jgi:hypothetical protein
MVRGREGPVVGRRAPSSSRPESPRSSRAPARGWGGEHHHLLRSTSAMATCGRVRRWCSGTSERGRRRNTERRGRCCRGGPGGQDRVRVGGDERAGAMPTTTSHD